MLVEILKRYVVTAKSETEAAAYDHVLGLLLLHIKRHRIVDRDLPEISINPIILEKIANENGVESSSDPTFDDIDNELTLGRVTIRLKPKAYELVKFLYHQPNQKAHKNEIETHLWSETLGNQKNQSNLSNLISYCRIKMPLEWGDVFIRSNQCVWLRLPSASEPPPASR